MAPNPAKPRFVLGIRQRIVPAAEFARLFFARIKREHISSAAAALSYSSMVAIVPALALLLAGFAAFPAFSPLRIKVQTFIVDNLIPDTGLQIGQALSTFIEAADRLTVFGVIGLIGTATLLLLTIEGQLNLVFTVTHPRARLARMLVFLALMTLGPVLLALGLSLFAIFSEIPFVTKVDADLGLRFLLGHLAPSLITWTLLTLLYRTVPHHRIRLRDAVLGALTAAFFLAVLRYGFVLYVREMTSYKAIYGALAAVPVFLVWLYAVWLMVMTGAVVTAILPAWRQRTNKRGGADDRTPPLA